MTEKWRPIPYCPKYEASTEGRVRHFRNQKVRKYKPYGWKSPYLAIDLPINGKIVRKSVAHVILDTFVGSKPNGCEACHKDDNPKNNRLSNLMWGTDSQNRLQSYVNRPELRMICSVAMRQYHKNRKEYFRELINSRNG